MNRIVTTIILAILCANSFVPVRAPMTVNLNAAAAPIATPAAKATETPSATRTVTPAADSIEYGAARPFHHGHNNQSDQYSHTNGYTYQQLWLPVASNPHRCHHPIGNLHRRAY
jgi:hypothetical protein